MRRLFVGLALCAAIFALPQVVRPDVPTPLVTPTVLSTANAAVTIPRLAGQSSISFSVGISAFSGTIVAECTTNGPFDTTQSWTQVPIVTRAGLQVTTISTSTDGTVAACPSTQQFRIRVATYTSGNATVTVYGTSAIAFPIGPHGGILAEPITIASMPATVIGNWPSAYPTIAGGSGVLAAAPVGQNGSPYPQSSGGNPIVAPANNAGSPWAADSSPAPYFHCVPGTCPSPVPYPTSSGGNQVITPANNSGTPIAFDSSPAPYVHCVPGTCPSPIPYPTDTGGRQIVNDAAQAINILTSLSATACTNIKSAPTTLMTIWNAGPQMTVYPQFYNDGGTTCGASTLIYGDGSTMYLGGGQILTFRVYLSAGLAYKLSGALTSNLVIATF